MTWHVVTRPSGRASEMRGFRFTALGKCVVAVKPRRTSRGTGNRQHRPRATRHPAPRLSSATRTAPEARCQPGVGLIYPPYDATLLDARASR